MHLTRHNTARVTDNDLADLALGLTLAHPKDLAEHIQFLRDEANVVDKGTLVSFVQDVDAANDAARDAIHENVQALNALGQLAQIASGRALELVLEIQQHLHAVEERAGASVVSIPFVLEEQGD